MVCKLLLLLLEHVVPLLDGELDPGITCRQSFLIDLLDENYMLVKIDYLVVHELVSVPLLHEAEQSLLGCALGPRKPHLAEDHESVLYMNSVPIFNGLSLPLDVLSEPLADSVDAQDPPPLLDYLLLSHLEVVVSRKDHPSGCHHLDVLQELLPVLVEFELVLVLLHPIVLEECPTDQEEDLPLVVLDLDLVLALFNVLRVE